MSQVDLSRVVISPPIWHGRNIEVQPGDLSKFAPYGNGVYGYQKKNILDPIRGDPPQEPNAGIVYFENDVKREDFQAFLRVMGIDADRRDYAAFIKNAHEPLKERYFKQMRLISKLGLRFAFGVLQEPDYESFKEQELTTGDALWAFMEAEKERFGTSFGDPRIEGKMGGDGHFAREELSFGFMHENEYNQIYRIWSRAWLVTK